MTEKSETPVEEAKRLRARRRRTTAEILKDRHRIMRLYARGKTHGQIRKVLGRSVSLINQEIVAIKQEWINSGLRDYDAQMGLALQEIEDLQQEYLQSWLRSLEPVEIVTVERLPDGSSKETIRTEPSAGDPRYLEGVRWCMQKRIELFGLDAPKKFEVDVTAELKQFAVSMGLTVDQIRSDPLLAELFRTSGGSLEMAGIEGLEKIDVPRPPNVAVPLSASKPKLILGRVELDPMPASDLIVGAGPVIEVVPDDGSGRPDQPSDDDAEPTADSSPNELDSTRTIERW